MKDLINAIISNKNNYPMREIVQSIIWPLYLLILSILFVKMLFICKKHAILCSSLIIMSIMIIHFILYHMSMIMRCGYLQPSVYL